MSTRNAWIVLAFAVGLVACAKAYGDATAEMPADGGSLDGATEDALDERSAHALAEGAAPPDVTQPSCKAMLALAPNGAMSGIYDIAPGGVGTKKLQVYCDMALDGGGWTLVGRSAMGTGAPFVGGFGWRSTSGDVHNLLVPYSVDVFDAQLAFAEVLVADRDPSATVARSYAFKFRVPPDFLVNHSADAVAVSALATVLGDCAPDGGPTGLRYAGGTAFVDGFFLRASPASSSIAD